MASCATTASAISRNPAPGNKFRLAIVCSANSSISVAWNRATCWTPSSPTATERCSSGCGGRRHGNARGLGNGELKPAAALATAATSLVAAPTPSSEVHHTSLRRRFPTPDDWAIRVRIGRGPSSSVDTARSSSASSAASSADSNCTAPVSCRSQCPGSVTAPGDTSVPVTVLTSGTRATEHSSANSDLSTSRNASIIGVISGEWNPCDTASRAPLVPSTFSTASTASARPASTTLAGPLTLATLTTASSSFSSEAIAASAWATLRRTATMIPPSDGSACISRPRAIASRSPVSMDIAPATTAATISPTLCPSTTAGTIPRERHSSARLHSSANSPGWVCRVCPRREASSPFSSLPKTSARSEPALPPVSLRYVASQRFIATRKAGSAAYS